MRRLLPWRKATSARSAAFLGLLEGFLAEHERVQRYRLRARRPIDAERWNLMMEAVACDLAWLILAPTVACGLAISVTYRDQPLRYRNPAIGRCLPNLVKLLAETGLVDLARDPGQTAVTQCFPTQRLADLLMSCSVRREDIGWQSERSDPIVLTRTTKKGRYVERERVDYRETLEAAAKREEMRRINAHLAAADIGFIDDGLGHVDTDDRWLSRRFVVREQGPEQFDGCGRLFGGFYQQLPRSRRDHLRINGEPVVVLDYSSAFARIALAEQGVNPAGDVYAIPGIDGLSRKQMKAAISAFFFASPSMTTWPRDFEELGGDTADSLSGFPPEWTPKRLREAVVAHYPALASPFATASGDHLMHVESNVMVALLLAMEERGLVGLPLHDAILAPTGKTEALSDLMEEVSTAVVGIRLPVTVTS